MNENALYGFFDEIEKTAITSKLLAKATASRMSRIKSRVKAENFIPFGSYTKKGSKALLSKTQKQLGRIKETAFRQRKKSMFRLRPRDAKRHGEVARKARRYAAILR